MLSSRGQRSIALVLLLCTFLFTGRHAVAEDTGDYSAIDSKDLKILKNAEPILVAGYRLALVVRNGVKASAGQGNTTSETIVNLAGVDSVALQAVADKAYEDLLQQLAATGRPIIPLEQAMAGKGWGKLEFTPSAGDTLYLKKPFADSRTFAVLAPQALPLWWGHFDTPMGDKTAFNLSNWKALNQLSVDTKAVILVPQLAIDFATLEGGGHSVMNTSVATSAKADLRILEQQSVLRVFHAKIALAGDLGAGILKEAIPLDGADGKLVVASEWGNQDEVAFANLLSTNAPDGTASGPGLSFTGQDLAYIVDPAAFDTSVLDGAHRFNALVAAAVAAYRPGR